MSQLNCIVVRGLAHTMSISTIVKKLSWYIRGHFQVLVCLMEKKSKRIYLTLSPKLYAQDVCDKINAAQFGKYKFHAEICTNPPRSTPNRKKPKGLTTKQRRMMHIPLELPRNETLLAVLESMVRELEYKYTGLLELSKKTDHKLMENICSTIAQRIKQVASTMNEVDSPYLLSKTYRKSYPHFGDFQMILSTLHAIEDSQAKPRTQVSEKELSAVKLENYMVGNIPFNRVNETCSQYAKKIVAKVSQHINNLKLQSDGEESPEDAAARRKVREQLKKLRPYLPEIVKGVLSKNFVPRMKLYRRIRVYGEPYLPNREKTEPFFKQFDARVVLRDEKMFNLVMFNLHRDYYQQLMSKDGTFIGNCKLIIRSSDIPIYTIPEWIKRDLVSDTSKTKENIPMEEEWEQW